VKDNDVGAVRYNGVPIGALGEGDSACAFWQGDFLGQNRAIAVQPRDKQANHH